MAVVMKAWSLNFLDESSVLLLFERKKASWVADLLLVFTGRKNEELQVAAKVLVERRTERRRCAGDLSCCLLIWRKKKKEASYYLLGITCLVERNQCG